MKIGPAYVKEYYSLLTHNSDGYKVGLDLPVGMLVIVTDEDPNHTGYVLVRVDWTVQSAQAIEHVVFTEVSIPESILLYPLDGSLRR